MWVRQESNRNAKENDNKYQPRIWRHNDTSVQSSRG